ELVYHVRRELGYIEIIIEKYAPGEEFRICVIEDRVLGAMNRRPTNVTGDGVHNIRELIKLKNEIRMLNPHLTSRLIKIDRELQNVINRAGYTLESIPQKDKLVYLRDKSN